MLFATIALWLALGVTAIMAAPINEANATLPVVALDCGQTPAVCAALCDWITQSNDCTPATLSLDKAQHDQAPVIRSKLQHYQAPVIRSKAAVDPQRICYRDQVKARHNIGPVKARHDHLLRCGDCRDYTGSGECDVSVHFPPHQVRNPGLIARAQTSSQEFNTYHDQLDGLFAGKPDGWSFIAAVANFSNISQCGADYHATPRNFAAGGGDNCDKQPFPKARHAPHQTHEYTLESGIKVLSARTGTVKARDVFLVDSNHPHGGHYERAVEVKAVPMPPFIGPRRSEQPNPSAAVATTLEVACDCRAA